MKSIFKTFLTMLFFLGLTMQVQAATVTTIDVVEKDGVTTNNYPLTFGMVFKKGDVSNSVKVTLSGQDLQTQFDIKRHWDDGSVKHGVISTIIPQIQANDTITLTIETNNNSNNTGEMSKTEIQNKNIESRIELTNISGSGYSGSLTASLRDTINNTQTLDYWLKGHVCTEILLTQQLNNSLDATWEARYYPGTNFGVRVSNAMENVNAQYRGNINYAVDILTGTDSLNNVYHKDTFQHNESARWRKVFWIGPEPPETEIHYDLSYLISTGAIMNYDTSLQVSESTIQRDYEDRWLPSDHDIMGYGYIQKYFPTTGGRDDIGILPTWTVRYLFTMDNRMREIMLNHAEMASGAPIHYREGDSSRSFYGWPVSIDDRPTVWTRAGYAGTEYTYTLEEDKLPPAIGDTDTGWNVDRAHQPSLVFIPYLITGEKYYLDELMYWGAINLSRSNFNHDWGRDYDQGLIRDEVRGEAWAIRTVADAAAFLPDNWTMMRNYLDEKIQNNINVWMSEKDRYPLNMWGEFTKRQDDGLTSDIEKQTSPWMEDFVVLALSHMKDLGYPTKQILDWYGVDFTLNRFTHPDFNHFNGASYRFPVAYDDGTYVQTWAEADSKYVDHPTSFRVDGDPYSYKFIALGAVSCLFDYANGPSAYNFLKTNVPSQDVLNNSPTWAFVPKSSSNQNQTRADVDNNSTINTTDAMLTLRNSLGLSMSGTNWFSSTITGDVNCDGTSNSTDAMLILRHSLGLDMSGTGWCES